MSTTALSAKFGRSKFFSDELSEWKNADEAREQFIGAIKGHVKASGSWREIFDACWRHYVKERIPAQ